MGASPAKTADGVLVGSSGMTLCVFDRDPAGSGQSVCKQWAYKGKPLYFWAKDQKPGDRTGDGFNNVWHLAKP